MGYIYEMEFDISQNQMELLRVGEALEVGLGYLRALLPGEPGFVTSRAYYSIDTPDNVHVVFQSLWEQWEDLVRHRNHSYLDEDKMLMRFKPHIDVNDLRTHIFEEIP